MDNSLFLKRALKVAPAPTKANTFAEVATLDANLRTLGYTLHGDLAVFLLTNGGAEEVHALVPVLKEMRGVKQYRPMYKNFPTQVMEMDEAELYLNAIIHYWGSAVGIRILPYYKEEERPVMDFNDDKYKAIRLGSRDEFITLVNNLVHSKSAFSETDKADIEAMDDATFGRAVSDTDFPNRENKAWLAANAITRKYPIAGWKFDTATDILRFAVALSDGDVSLAEKTEFKSFSRPVRKLLLAYLNEIESPQEDMLRYEQAWKRLGERLHPSEYQGRFPNAAHAFEDVRNNATIGTFNSRVEALIASGDGLAAARLLEKRPGEFARRLDKVLRMVEHGKQAEILYMFTYVANKVSPTVLLQTRNAFLTRDKGIRTFMPKGSVAKMTVIPDDREVLPQYVCDSVIRACDIGLAKQFDAKDDLGGSYIDPALKKIAVPFGLRNASEAMTPLGRGSRLPLDGDTDTLRFFIWWKDMEDSGPYSWGGRVDIDLSAVVFDKDFNHLSEIAYYNLRDGFGGVHSGDITSAPEGASEFIDIDMAKFRKNGARYVAMTVHSYSGQNFVDVPECSAGFMQRNKPGSGEIYDPRTVTNRVSLTAASKGATPFVFDLDTGEAVWVDLTMAVRGWGGNALNSRTTIQQMLNGMVNLNPPNLYDLFEAHALSRGGLVSKEKANTVFGFDGDVSPYDTEKILSEFL